MLSKAERFLQHLLGINPSVPLQARVEELERTARHLEEELQLMHDLLESARSTVDNLEARANEWINVKGYN